MITVLTTVRNGMPFIAEAIASVRAQEYKNYRHCIVDDGSSDGTTEFLRSEENRDLDVIVSPPVGRGVALNLGSNSCKSDFLAILDADDVASPCWLAAMVKIMEQNRDIAVLSCRGTLAIADMELQMCSQDEAYRLTPEMFLSRNPVHHSGTLIRRQSLLKAGGYDESRSSLFDYELWVRLLQRGEQIWRIDRGYIYKRIHTRQHFEGRKRINYLLGCYQIRRRVSSELLGGRGAMIPPLALVYGLLPRIFRHWRYRRNHSKDSA